MKRLITINLFLISMLLLSACSSPSTTLQNRISEALRSVANALEEQEVETLIETPESGAQELSQPTPAQLMAPSESSGLMAAYEGTLIKVYEEVNPSVVNIRVLAKIPSISIEIPSSPDLPFNIPGLPGMPSVPEGQTPGDQYPETPQYAEGLGSGFIWDKKGHIVTNNHVVTEAEKIEITFSDGTIFPAELVGSDPYSDLAVLKVKVPSAQLKPLQLIDSNKVKVGELAIAIGNPFGLEGTMTVGIISAKGRTMPVSEGVQTGPTYSIPDVIQTDAPINPGSSGGVLVNEQGQVIGVTFAIESAVQANSGVGFVIPATIVNRVVPVLIENGHYDHPYIGISGGDLTPDLVKAMNLKEGQRGILVNEVLSNSPADKAGLRGSNNKVEIDGQEVSVGGDVITAINGQALKGMDDLISYLANNTSVGQQVTLSILQEGKSLDVEVTLEARPGQSEEASAAIRGQAKAYLGITGLNLNNDIAKAMGLDEDQLGVLVEQVQDGSPADQAGLHGGSERIIIQGQPVRIGGDVIVALDEQQVNTIQGLKILLENLQPDQAIILTILRNGEEMKLKVTLGEPPT